MNPLLARFVFPGGQFDIPSNAALLHDIGDVVDIRHTVLEILSFRWSVPYNLNEPLVGEYQCKRVYASDDDL